jgi:hypothetical protein
MKHLSIFYILCSMLLLSVASCTDNDDIRKAEPGTYYVGKDLNAVVSSKQTRGIDPTDYHFDTNYDYDYIYLHKIGSAECIQIPVYDNCPNNTDETTCTKGFRYRIEVDETGNATITPLDKEGNEIGDTSITFNANEQCYFSSWPTDEWAMNKNQFSEEKLPDQEESYYLYYRDKEINKEIYRSGAGNKYQNHDIVDLTTNGDLSLTRACASFTSAVLLYDKENAHTTLTGAIEYVTEAKDFSDTMGDDPSNWYIKIYIGGKCFATNHNIETGDVSTDHPNGYYSSGDAVKFGSGDIDGKKYLPLSQNIFSNTNIVYQGFGYVSESTNTLFSPVTGKDQVKVYLLIKHWTGSGKPDEEWLYSDIGAIQTEIAPQGIVSTPTNSHSYITALVIDLAVFKKAWEDNYGPLTPSTGSESSNASSLATHSTITRSPSGDPVRTFTLPEDAIIIQEVY